MDAEGVKDLADVGDETERLAEEFLHQRERARPRNPSELGFEPKFERVQKLSRNF